MVMRRRQFMLKPRHESMCMRICRRNMKDSKRRINKRIATKSRSIASFLSLSLSFATFRWPSMPFCGLYFATFFGYRFTIPASICICRHMKWPSILQPLVTFFLFDDFIPFLSFQRYVLPFRCFAPRSFHSSVNGKNSN